MVDHTNPPASRMSTIAGSLAAVLMLLSAPAHSLLGWPELRAELGRTGAPADLVRALQIGWHFGGLAMAAFGAITLHVFRSPVRDGLPSTGPAWVVAALYLGFGAAALLLTGFDPFFLVFIVPGALVLLGLLA
jgi:hypothetical protein